MEDKKQSQIFNFKLTIEECLDEMDKIREKSIDKFKKITDLGNEISKAAKEENLDELESLIDSNLELIPYMRVYIEDAFEQILTLRFDDIIKFFLEKGLDIKENFKQSLIVLTNTASLFPDDPPVDTLKLLLKYGADPNQTEKEKYRTPLHLSCKYGIFDFVKILCESGAQINSVDGKQNTPMKYIQKKLKKGQRYEKIYNYLKQNGGELDWRTYMKENDVY